MEISNQKRSRKIKRSFNITGIVIVLVGLLFLWIKNDILVMVMVGVFVVYLGIAQFANLCYIYFSTANEKVLLKYYPIISLFKKEYESIEFAQKYMVGFKIEKSMGFEDLSIAIRTKRGIAEYPSISLTALSKDEIEQIRSALAGIMSRKKALQEK